MKQKIRFGVEVLLVVAAITVAIYNFGVERQIAYLASIVAVCGTVAILIKDIYKAKKSEQIVRCLYEKVFVDNFIGDMCTGVAWL